jgi:hypothetical protein
MTITNQKISSLVPDQIPGYILDSYPLFVTFMVKYFQYLDNSSSGVQYSLQNLIQNRDIDTTAENLQNEFLNTYMPGFPNTSAADKTILVKYFREFYKLKGSEKSFKFFFRAFFGDEDAAVTYPRDHLFKPSSGQYYVERRLEVTSDNTETHNLARTLVTGQTNGATALVEFVTKPVGLGTDNTYNLLIQHDGVTAIAYDDNGDPIYFTTGETVIGNSWDWNTGASSEVIMTVAEPLNTFDGVYLDTHGQLSSDQLLQDSYYYQQYSYVLKTREDRALWADTILNYMHPTGTKMFNDIYVPTAPGSIPHTNIVETSVRIPVIKKYLSSPTFTFDRVGDVITGTSTTQIATSTGFATVTYTTANSVHYAYAAGYDYPGLNITWALQKPGDTSFLTEITTQDGPSFDKLNPSVSLDQQLIAYPLDVNTSLVVTRYITGSSNLAANTLLTSFTTKVLTYSSALSNATSVGSMIMLITWVKTSQGNNAAGEGQNAVVISFSSNNTIVPYFNDETQRNLKRVALGESLEYNKLNYVHSSNSISSAVSSNTPFSSYAVTGQPAKIVFKPYNWERGQTYDRVALRIEMDRAQQINTSLTETFASSSFSTVGLISSYGSSSFTTSFGANSFAGTTSNTLYTFSSNCMVFNGNTSQTRFVQSIPLTTSSLVTGQISFVAGDGFNGGNIPYASQDLELQYSLNNGSTWFSTTKLWAGSSSNLWTYGTTSLSGLAWTKAGSTWLTGIGTLFGTVLNVGDRLVLAYTSTTTTYTVTAVTNNNLVQVTPAFVDNNLNLQPLSGTAAVGAGNVTITGSGSQYTKQLLLGQSITLTSSNTATSYVITGIIDDSTLTINPSPVDSYTSTTIYEVTGIPVYYRKPAAQQVNTTSLTVYGAAGGPATSVLVRIIQIGPVAPNTVNYVLNTVQLTSWRYQATTGTVNISVAVSSNSTLNISDNDFFTVTTIGI